MVQRQTLGTPDTSGMVDTLAVGLSVPYTACAGWLTLLGPGVLPGSPPGILPVACIYMQWPCQCCTYIYTYRNINRINDLRITGTIV